MSILSIVLQSILALGFLMFGFTKFGSKQMVEEFKRYGLPAAFRIFTGLVELAGGVFMAIGIWKEQFAAIGGIVVVVTMIGAVATHVRVKDPASKLGMPFVLLILGLVVLFINWGALIG
ncbi:MULTISPECIES: DoxX family protein [Paenibacillus]|uniref:DoxX family protein n=1 Tax=Paenibacillus agri TaxID=2744309 RepID=A0A850EFA3_9BACL|nr:DoxX family protein [Paenibacillus agri]NUU59825.1 DoxX family protein [Paenibacillus agri]